MYKNKNEVVEDSFQAFLVDGANFTSIEEYPIIEEQMLTKEMPRKIMPFNKAINYRGNLSDVFVSFYSPDGSFERVRKNPKKYLNFFNRTAGFIGFDFSVHTDMPLVKQKSQMNDNLSLTYYFAKNAVKCIPNIRYGIDETADEFLSAIPKHCLIAIGTHGFIKRECYKAEWYCNIEKIIDFIEPVGIVVVGPLDKKIIEDFSSRCKFYLYDSWMEENRREFYNEKRK